MLFMAVSTHTLVLQFKFVYWSTSGDSLETDVSNRKFSCQRDKRTTIGGPVARGLRAAVQPEDVGDTVADFEVEEVEVVDNAVVLVAEVELLEDRVLRH